MANLLVSWNQLFNCVTFASWLKRVITMQIITDIRMWQLSQRSLFLYFSLTIHHVHKRQKELSLNEFSQVEIYTIDENKIKVILLLYQLILPYHENLPLNESSQVEITVNLLSCQLISTVEQLIYPYQ